MSVNIKTKYSVLQNLSGGLSGGEQEEERVYTQDKASLCGCLTLCTLFCLVIPGFILLSVAYIWLGIYGLDMILACDKETFSMWLMTFYLYWFLLVIFAIFETLERKINKYRNYIWVLKEGQGIPVLEKNYGF